MTESEWLSAGDATELWAFVRSRTLFNRRLVDSQGGQKYNRRILYLMGVAACRRLEYLSPDPCCQRMLQVAEAFAEGAATLDELINAHEDVDDFRCSQPADVLPAAKGAVIEAVFWLSPDDYKVIRALEYLADAAGYLSAVAAGCLPAGATLQAGRAVWKHEAFLGGRKEEEQALCHLIRDIVGDPFHPSPPIPPAALVWNDGTLHRMAKGIYEGRTFDLLPVLADALEEAGCEDAAILAHCREPGPHVRGCWATDALLGKT